MKARLAAACESGAQAEVIDRVGRLAADVPALIDEVEAQRCRADEAEATIAQVRQLVSDWRQEANEHTIDGYTGIAEGLTVAADSLLIALDLPRDGSKLMPTTICTTPIQRRV